MSPGIWLISKIYCEVCSAMNFIQRLLAGKAKRKIRLAMYSYLEVQVLSNGMISD